jgi:hypothetical protein
VRVPGKLPATAAVVTATEVERTGKVGGGATAMVEAQELGKVPAAMSIAILAKKVQRLGLGRSDGFSGSAGIDDELPQNAEAAKLSAEFRADEDDANWDDNR